jgi:hypothetical protein
VEGGKHRHVPKHLNERKKKKIGVNFDVLITMAGAKKIDKTIKNIFVLLS